MKKNFYLFIGVLSAVFIISFYSFYGENDLFRIPFNSAVWGNASDWVMIVVTGITAFFIWRTFVSQNKLIEIQNETLREQQKITRIELINHKERIKPSFELEITNFLRTKDDNEEYFEFTFAVSAKDNDACNIVIDVGSPFLEIFQLEKLPIKIARAYKNQNISLPFIKIKGRYLSQTEIYNNTKDPNFKGSPITFLFTPIFFSFKFENVENNPYQQQIVFIKEQDLENTISGPVIEEP